ncbi:MAG: preprotein translocase subunit YajC [Myxococcaceae bacterium]|nr:preprotein translocase subunit YajC [Myxococcaceae bacterium]
MTHFFLLAQAGGGAGSSFLIPGLAFFGVMVYLLILRPQQKQLRDQQSLISSLKKGDEVVTQAGVLGKVVAVQDKIVTIEVASSLKLRVLKSSIQGKLADDAGPVKAEEPVKEKEEK